MIKYILGLLFIVVIIEKSFSQQDTLSFSIQAKVDEIMKIARAKKSIWPKYNKYFKMHRDLTYQFLKTHENDSLPYIRSEVVSYYLMLYEGATNNLKKKIISSLLDMHKYGPFANIENKFSQSDFDKSAKEKIRKALKEESEYDLLLTVGIVGLKDQISELKKFLPEGNRFTKTRLHFFYSLEWAARLAMARLGDKEHINFCIDKIKSIDILKNSYGYGDYMDYLIYIKQPEVLPYLFELLLANKPFKDEPIYTSSGAAIYALRELLKDFPPEMGYSLTEKGVEKYRKWIEDYKGKYKFKE